MKTHTKILSFLFLFLLAFCQTLPPVGAENLKADESSAARDSNLKYTNIIVRDPFQNPRVSQVDFTVVTESYEPAKHIWQEVTIFKNGEVYLTDTREAYDSNYVEYTYVIEEYHYDPSNPQRSSDRYEIYVNHHVDDETVYREKIYTQELGAVIGHLYSTDITAYIDGMPIPSYNIGGETVIAVEDLRSYGFEVIWDAEERTLTADVKERPEQSPEVALQPDTPGKIVGNIYCTDIVTRFNGIAGLTDTYNIGGTTYVAIEDLGKFRPDHTGESVGYQGYSIYAMDYTWSNEERCIRLRTLRPGDTIQTEFGPAIIKYLTPADAYGYYFVEGMENTEMHPIHFAGIQCELQDTPCIDVTDIPSSFGIRGSAEDGVYTITAPTAKKVTYAQATAYNGPLNYTQIRLIVSVPLCINGQFINTEEANCILAPDDPSLYVSAKLLSENTGYTFENY